ncbi:hypothetical protein [Streptomyces ossamyceticus]|uniref:hypothetical protein n=1 Tax=Streptomyces ossamyceticus TaxID=249581 RepID=UPI000AFCBA0D|nr:hypothetical protein [Streptomyces ossamyceticus]
MQQFSDPSNTGNGPFIIVDGRMIPYTPAPAQDTGDVPVGSAFAAENAEPTGPFVVIDGVVRPYEPTASAVPVPGSAPVAVPGIMSPLTTGTAGGGANGTAPAVSWSSVAITAIVAAVVVTCMLMGMSTEAIIAGIVLIVLLANHVRTALV